MLVIIFVIFSFGYSHAQLFDSGSDSFIFPLGLILFASVISIKIWGRSNVAANQNAKLLPKPICDASNNDDGGINVAQIS